jgi:hypothetical protein
MASERQINVGGVLVGGGAPVVVQTMTKTETANVAADDAPDPHGRGGRAPTSSASRSRVVQDAEALRRSSRLADPGSSPTSTSTTRSRSRRSTPARTASA